MNSESGKGLIGETDNEDYQKKKVMTLQQLDASRFVPMANRKNVSDLSIDAMKTLTYMTNWKGVESLQSPMDMWLFKEIISEIKPKTIIEIGTGRGGSALWMADLVNIFNLDTQIYTMDINPSLRHSLPNAEKRITFLEGDSFKIGETFDANMLLNLPHPWLIFEDAHCNVDGILKHFHPFMSPGDYFIVEDTHPVIHEQYGTIKWDVLLAFVQQHASEYMVDTKYCDMFGYNGTYNMNGFLMRV